MKIGITTQNPLCMNRHKSDAVCRRLKRCRKCGRVLAFNFGDALCSECAGYGADRRGPHEPEHTRQH